MVVIKKKRNPVEKVTVQVEHPMRYGVAYIQFPKFYIKAVGGQFSIEHRLTHTYLESVDTEEELVEAISKWNGMSDEELYTYLLYKRFARFPQNKIGNKLFTHEEDWYEGAWSGYTGRFYTKYPELLVEVPEIDFELLTSIKRKKFEKESAESKRKLAEMHKVAEELDVEEKAEKVVSASLISEDKKEVEKKRVKKKLRIKVIKDDSGIGIPIVNYNPFE